ncbi:hypothetical protein D9M68_723510 [compost metagenome]
MAAVTAAGRPRVSSASSTARSGSSSGEITTFFSPAPVVTTDTAVTSEPVPAVVGTRISGNRGPLARLMP